MRGARALKSELNDVGFNSRGNEVMKIGSGNKFCRGNEIGGGNDRCLY